ncbi:amino acid ABC transporter permease [Paenibacillus sp. GCM10023252]|uniref:amino acid ABC transporter permease n=1 Tax=Paenibacillus sp. GCM10023252 TaxID=3252649 RepID=UPI00361AE3C9
MNGYGDTLWEIALNAFPKLLYSAVMFTIPLTICGMVFGLLIGIVVAIARLVPNKAVNLPARIYVSYIRGTPLLVQLYLIFYGLTSFGIYLKPLTAAIIGLSMAIGAYASEAIRGAIISIPKGQWEAAASIDLGFFKTYTRIILPQAIRVATPGLSNVFIGLLKETSLVSVVLVPDMFRKAQEIVAYTFEPLLIYSLAGLIYWVIVLGMSKLQSMIERRFSRGYV